MNPLLISPLLDIAGKAFDKIFPDKEAAEKAKLEFARQTAAMEQNDVQSFRDFMVAYEGKGELVHPAIQILRGSVRPILTYFLAGSFVYGFVNPTVIEQDTMTMLFQLNLLSLGFWYGERALKNLGLNMAAKKSPETDK